MKHILDSSFKYTPSFATDIKKTFERVRKARTTPEPVQTDARVVSLAEVAFAKRAGFAS